MNSVSWFLYLVDISEGVGTFIALLSGASIIAAIGLLIAGAMYRDRDWDRNDWDERKEYGISLQWKALWFAIPTFVFMFLAFLIPSKDTLYMIGASQIGEQIVALEEVQELGGEVGGLAKDTIALLREKIQTSLAEPTK